MPSPNTRLLASGLGEDGPGGLFVLDPERGTVEQLDHIATCGLALDDSGTRLARLLWTDDDPQGAGELVLYDQRGVRAYHRLDAVREPHGARWDGDELAIVSTLDDSILWFDDAGREQRRWTGHGGGDCWHVNCLGVTPGGQLVASAFGRFEGHRGWAGPGRREGQGLVFDPTTGEELLTGLHAPHDPTSVGDGWLVCNSGERELLELGADGLPRRRVDLGGWTRGLAFDDDHVYVGISANRHAPGQAGHAQVAVLDRASLEVRDRLDLPCPEVFSLVLVPDDLLAGVRTGFGTNRRRSRDRVLVDLEQATANVVALTDREARLRIAASGVPGQTAPGAWLSVAFAASNEGPATLASIEPHPVLIGARWADADGEATAAEARAGLRQPLLPGHTGHGLLRVRAPTDPGTYRLTIGGLQEHLRWFDELDPELAVSFEVVVP